MNPTSSVVIIGNEILSGRTLDLNTQYIAKKLSEVGIVLLETRTISDNIQIIIDTVSELKSKYDYIFTTGGIGPTHDDITSQAIAMLFKVPLELNESAYLAIKKSYESKNIKLNVAAEKMARIPKGAILINNPISGAPGFYIENVYVTAGVPYIMQAMIDQIIEQLKHGDKIFSKNIDLKVIEGVIAEDFSNLQNKYKDIEMGSYPFRNDKFYGTSLVLRSYNHELLLQAYKELMDMIAVNSWEVA